MFQKRIETPRLILRPFTLEDVRPSFEMEQDPDISKYTQDGGVKTLEQVERLISGVINGDYQRFGFGRFAVEFRETGEFIGFCGLKYLFDDHEVDLGYRIRKDMWGKGLASEACRASLEYGFTELNIPEIVAYILPDNKLSIRVIEKLNFQFKEKVMEEGDWVNKYQLTSDQYTKIT